MNLRNFHSSRWMTRRSLTCRSALLMVLPKRRNNLYISILPGVSLWPACTRDSGWREEHCSWQERAPQERAWAQRARAQRAQFSWAPRQERAQVSWAPRQERAWAQERDGRLGRSGLRRIGSRGIHAELPHPAQALVEPVRAGRCAFHQLVSVRALYGGEFRPEPISGPLHLLKGGASRQCVSRAHGGEQALVRSHSARRGRHRRREGKQGDGAKSGCRRQKTLYKSTLVSTLVVTVFETSI